MTRGIYVFFLLVCMSCTQKMICPAYQSAFIYDKGVQKETFVYYNENKDQSREIIASNSKAITLPARDSSWSKSVVLPGPALPKERKVKKDRYLLLPDKTYKKALRSLQTVAMKPVYPKKPDSTQVAPDLIGAELDSADSVTVVKPTDRKAKKDSVYVISIEKEKFNLDQDNYMWYFREILVLPDVRLAMEGNKENKEAAGKPSKGGFFKNLFKKKDKSKSKLDSTQVSPSSDSTRVEESKEKKGLGGLFKKKPKADKAQPVKKTDPAKKEEEDDGF